MRRIGSIALITLAVLTAAMVLVLPSGLLGSLMDGAMILRAGGRFPPDATRVYKPTPTRPLKMHIFKPRTGDEDAKGVTAVLFHGGGFHSGWPEEYFPLARELADAGHTAFVPQYRLQRADGATWTDEFEDVLDAIDWTRAHAAEFGSDPERLVLGGSSAGAHLAAAAVTVPPPDGRQPPAAIGLLLAAAYVDSGNASQRSRERAANASFVQRALLGEPQDVFEGRSLAYSPRAPPAFRNAPDADDARGGRPTLAGCERILRCHERVGRTVPGQGLSQRRACLRDLRLRKLRGHGAGQPGRACSVD